VPTVWELLSRSGVEVGVTAWWASWPADAVRGFLVSDRISYQLFGFRSDVDDATGKTWPPDLYEDIRPLIVAPEEVPWERVTPYLGGERTRRDEFSDDEAKMLDDFRTLLASGDTYMAIAESLRRRFEPQLEVIYLEGTDTVGHLFMPYRPPRLPGIDEARFDSFSPIVDRYYETADEFLGRLLEGRDESWTVMVLSDHGFAADATRPRVTDSRIGHGPAADWHRRFGILVLAGANVKREARIEEASIYDIAPTVLALFGQPVPRSWPGRVLSDALAPEFVERHPVLYRNDDPERRDLQAERQIDPAAADLLEKLQNLGYISSASPGSDSMTGHNNAGVALIAEGKFAEAEQEFRAGLEVEPEAPMLWVNLGLALRFQGRVDEAVPLFERALGAPGAMRVAAHQLAQLRLDAGDAAGAEQLLRRVLEHEPGAAELRNLLGLALERQGDLAGAEQEYRESARLDPDAALARNNLGNLAKRREQLDEAESWYRRAIEADPYFMGAYNNLALVYQTRGEMQRAIDLYRRALGKAPNNAIVLNNLASLYYAREEYDEARRLWTQSMRADPSYPSPLNNLASLLIHSGQYAEAERLLRRAIELDPDYGDARMNLALVLRERGDHEEAREQLQLAVQDPRTGVKSWLQLGMMEIELGRAADAIATLSAALERAPGRVDLLNALGEAHFRAGERERALELWRRSLELQPAQPRLERALTELSGGDRQRKAGEPGSTGQ
jgi:Flp pilus assembly protein TadD